ncbi:hypothetical protein SAMN04488128_105493 [Chitinophaga eiseniae]|uniref:Uncharacterized protein n=1 Tax=Chitinophaga eiseniae TaxID=634771 RepID=A0A1T4TMR6_9BACT|nr:hypothetical protein [Chitinophaga eiseniae]SKA41704.1 hypothetical protein SAMN04488128_105493 [Chitinophaga eiseniae]
MVKNTEIFKLYDMVISMTTETINEELENLQNKGTIHSQLIISQVLKGVDYIYAVHEKESEIPEDAAFINAELIPQISIPESGQNITLELHLKSGTARFWSRRTPNDYPIEDWVYSINLNLGLNDVEKSETKILQPADVKKRIKEFTDDKFSVNALMMDFESVEKLPFFSEKTQAGKAGDVGIEGMIPFMNFYLTYLRKTGNPYILGYAIEQRTESNTSRDHLLPSSLTPKKVNYTMFKDENPAISTLNFLLITKNNEDKKLETPDKFPKNWISAAEGIDAKMIISRADLLEKLLLEPLFNKIKEWGEKTLEELKFKGAKANSFEQAQKIVNETNKTSYVISENTSGDNQYTNKIEVSFKHKVNEGAKKQITSVEVGLDGYIKIYMSSREENPGPLKDHVEWASTEVKWKGGFIIKEEKEGDNPKLNVVISEPVVDKPIHHHGESGLNLRKILMGLLEGVLGPGGALFEVILHSMSGATDVGQVKVKDAFANLSNSINTTILLPGGNIFYFKNPAIDDEGNFSLLLTYKSAH